MSEEDEPESSSVRKRNDTEQEASEAEEKHPARAWSSFGGGSGLARWGVWFVFLGFVYGLVLFGYISAGVIENDAGPFIAIHDLGGPFFFAPFFGLSFIGVIFTLMGRTRMLSIPKSTGAKKVFLGVWLFTMIHFLAATAGLIFVVMSGLEWSGSIATGGKGGDYLAFAFVAFLIGLPFWVVSDFSIIPAIAIVGGAMPSLRLRRRVGSIVFGLQILLVFQIVLGVFGGFFIDKLQKRRGYWRDRPPEPTFGASRPPINGGGYSRISSHSEEDKQTLIVVLAILMVTQLVYSSMFASLYGAGRTAVVTAREDEEFAAEEDT